jgi:hypothetical protein
VVASPRHNKPWSWTVEEMLGFGVRWVEKSLQDFSPAFFGDWHGCARYLKIGRVIIALCKVCGFDDEVDIVLMWQ